MSTRSPNSPRIVNRKATHRFEILDRVEAGVALKGTEVKSLRLGNASLGEAYARLEDDSLVLLNFQIQPYANGNRYNHDPKRPKQLLLHRREIKKLAAKIRIRGQTLVPLAVYFNERGLAKVELGLARGKSFSDKRETERRRSDMREIERARRRH